MELDIFKILTEANEKGASDIHISTGERVLFRVSGSMRAQEQWPILDYQTARALLEQTMEDGHKSSFDDDKDLDYAIEITGVARFRVNTFFTTKGVNAVFRIIPSEIIPFEKLGLPPSLKQVMSLKKGLVVVTGPTGSGKSTTLAAIIDLFNKTKYGHILTIEDPVEFVHTPQKCLITHREVGKHTKSFGSALRAVTRQDPDIVLVGEMRDLETISLALTAAETGALVFGTLHTSSAAKTINRIIDVFSAEEQAQVRSMLADSVRFIVAQALLKKIGGGRVGAYEVLIGTDAVANQIRQNEVHQIPLSIQGGRAIGMQSMDQCLQDHLEAKRVTYDDAIVHALNKEVFRKYAPQDAAPHL